MLHCQHDSSPGPSCNSHRFMQHCHCDSSPGLSCNFHDFLWHCYHFSSLNLLDNLPIFVSYVSSLCNPHSTFCCRFFLCSFQKHGYLAILIDIKSLHSVTMTTIPRLLHMFTLAIQYRYMLINML